ncbi:50S ribosomal protein L3 [Chlamydiales bacterium SCGC AG-110-M15]|nr:50S ribosomal protein L3 [Chlamydiales bacterium SCGC AG-110-M15]
MTLKLMGKKRGMTQLFDEKGNKIVCTVIECEPNVITQIKTKEKDGYEAVQTSFGKVKTKDERTLERRLSKPRRSFFAKAEIEPRKHSTETRGVDLETFELGQEFGVEIFEDIKLVDVYGVSIGKGYQGLMKKNNFRGGPAAHGSGFHRHAGSTGMRSTPGRCLEGGPRPSQMGNKSVKVENLEVVKVDAERGLILVKGAIPGSNNSLVTIANSTKKPTLVSAK